MSQLNFRPIKRKNPFTDGRDEWILISPQRMQRPWSGKTEVIHEAILPIYDEHCVLCPGNKRQNENVNPDYTDTFVFPNDNPAFLHETEPREYNTHHPAADALLFQEVPVSGVCEVVVYSPKHDRLMMHMSQEEIVTIINTWSARYTALGSLPTISHVAIFETRGEELGNSVPHPHGQIWAESEIPPVMLPELKTQQALSAELGKNAMISYVEKELAKNERLIYFNESFGIVVPFWATWPYETMIIPLQPVSSIDHLSSKQISDLAKALWIVPNVYAQLFERPHYGAAYMMGIHQKPTDGKDYSFFQMHIHFRTPMLTPSRQKFAAGYEEYSGYQRDLTPEAAAATLKKKLAELILPF